ncbi:hypothetical protein CBS101457_003949 [Exobasidium rhododendri]|nr:hypothetical protein CBS101457_003949 [Exobasidium rhododendri]
MSIFETASAASFSLPGVDLNNITSIGTYYQEHAIPQHYNAGVIVASVAVAILGSYVTLFVLGKRTGNSGARNVFLLLLGATTMSFVGIWGMHFIGMYMRLQATPSLNWYINFNPGFTVFSFVVPCISLVFSFLFVDQDSVNFRLWRVVVAGSLTGGTVALMHYSASFYCNFNVSFGAGQVVGSILLACICCTVGLTAFFRFRSQWQDSWWKRGLCAIILGAGVSSMHYIGTSGTSYRLKNNSINYEMALANGKRRNDILVIIIGVTCIVVVVVSSFIAFSDFFVTRESRKKARKLVVASATFDMSGRLMVQSDGTLPLITIEERTLRNAEVLEALNQRSSIFQWLYTVSWDWEIVVPFLDAIAEKVFETEKSEQRAFQRHALTTVQKARRLLSGRHKKENEDVLKKHSSAPLLDFRDKVVDAARRLASELDTPLPSIGIFYDQVLPTGTKRAVELAAARDAYRRRLDPSYTAPSPQYDDEQSIGSRAATSVFGEGSDEEQGATIFVVREVLQEERIQLAKQGYRFTETRFLTSVLADRHNVAKSEMESTLEALRIYARRGAKPVVQPGGVYAGLFGVRPNSMYRAGGLDVLVYSFARHQIPAYRLPEVTILTEEMLGFLKTIDQMPMEGVMTACRVATMHLTERCKTLSNYLKLQVNSQEELERMKLREEEVSIQSLIHFQQALFTSLEALHRSVSFFPQVLTLARVSSEVLTVPSSLVEDSPPAQIILIQAVLPAEKVYTRSSTQVMPFPTEKPSPDSPFVLTPYIMFAKAQMMMFRGQLAEDFEEEVAKGLTKRYRARKSAGTMEASNVTDDVTKASQAQSEKSHDQSSRALGPADVDDNRRARSLKRKPLLARFPGAALSSASSSDGLHKTESKASIAYELPMLPIIPASFESSSHKSFRPNPSPDFLNLPRSTSGSLGIRRFIENNNAGAELSLTQNDQSRFVRTLTSESVMSVKHPHNYVQEEEDDGENDSHSHGIGIASSEGHSPLTSTATSHPLLVNPASPRESTAAASRFTRIRSKSEAADKSRPQSNPLPGRPAANSLSFGREYGLVTASNTDGNTEHRRARTANAIPRTPSATRLNFENWQARQMEELEKFQPNLLLGILPSEY